MLRWRWRAGGWLGAQRLSSHDLHEATDAATSHTMTQFSEVIADLPRPEKRAFHVDYVDEADRVQYRCGSSYRVVF
jgi:hypothetical protein